MNILHVVDQISQQTAGGSAKVPFQLAKAQSKLGHSVTIYTSDFNAINQEAPKGVNMVKFHCLINLLGGIRITPGLLVTNFQDYDIIHLHNYRTFQNLITAKIAVNVSMPYIVQAHGNSLPIQRGVLVPIHNIVWRNGILRKADRLIVDSEQEVQNYLNEKADNKKIIELPVGIDSDEFMDLPDKQRQPVKQVLFLGRIEVNKGLGLLISAMRYVQGVNLIVAGPDYGFQSQAMSMASEYGIGNRVSFVGPLYGRDKLQAYINADLFVMPSRYEMWGLTFMESLACGTPVLLTDTCAAAGHIKYPLGEVAPYDDVLLACKIKSMLKNDYGDKYREHRRWWVRQYSWSSLAPKYISLYKDILRERVLRND